MTTAGNHYLAVAVFRALQFVHHGADLVAGGNEEHLVTHFDHGAADQLERVVAAKNGCHSHVGIGQVIAQFAQLVADQHAAITGTHADQLRLAVGKVHHLQGAGVFHQPLDMVGDHLLGADADINRQRLGAEQFVAQ